MVNVATFGIIKTNNMKQKQKQKQLLSEMMQEDEKSGLYDETLKLKRNYDKHK